MLYNLENDPNETKNLYHDPAAQGTVAECRRRLLEWLILSTRYVTVLPGPTGLPPSRTARLAPDCKESNFAGGVEDRIQRKRLNYL